MKRRALLCSTAAAVGLAGCPSSSSEVSLSELEVMTLDTTAHKVHIATSEGEEVVLLNPVSVPAASRERGTLHAESVTVELPAPTIPNFELDAKMANGEEIHRLGVNDFGESGEFYVRIEIGRNGRLAIFSSDNTG